MAGSAGRRPAVTPRDASTAILVRDTDSLGGLEVLLLGRTHDAAFAPGALVFPGGVLDPADAELGDPFWIAAVRECFEEAGVLLARDERGELVRFDDPDTAARFDVHRKAVYTGELSMAGLCDLETLTLAVDELHPFGHWITPEPSPRRFDTRFFIAAAPPGQDGTHDDGETVSSAWMRPADALAQSKDGAIDLILPTARSLKVLSQYERAADAIEAAARRLPFVSDMGGWRMPLPGEA